MSTKNVMKFMTVLHISYDRKNKKCKLFNTCKLSSSISHDSYSKKSLLRNNGYNIENAILINKNLPSYT